MVIWAEAQGVVRVHIAAAKPRTTAVHRSRAAVLRDVGAGTWEAYLFAGRNG